MVRHPFERKEQRGIPNLSDVVACTLVDTELKTQRKRWINVGANFGLDREETGDGLPSPTGVGS